VVLVYVLTGTQWILSNPNTFLRAATGALNQAINLYNRW